jgi:hypothetical protein
MRPRKKKAHLPNRFWFDGFVTILKSLEPIETICTRCGFPCFRSPRTTKPVCIDCRMKKNNYQAKMRKRYNNKDAHSGPLGPKEPDMV